MERALKVVLRILSIGALASAAPAQDLATYSSAELSVYARCTQEGIDLARSRGMESTVVALSQVKAALVASLVKTLQLEAQTTSLDPEGTPVPGARRPVPRESPPHTHLEWHDQGRHWHYVPNKGEGESPQQRSGSRRREALNPRNDDESPAMQKWLSERVKVWHGEGSLRKWRYEKRSVVEGPSGVPAPQPTAVPGASPTPHPKPAATQEPTPPLPPGWPVGEHAY
jgi:hypothetical protein